MMKQLKLEDYSIIKPYLDMADYEGYNSNFVTMMMWNHEYHIMYEIHDHFLIMLHHYKETKFWAMPFTTSQYYQEAIDYMIEYSHQHHFPFIIDCAIESFVEQIKSIYQNQLLFQKTPYNDDYIYDRQMLQTLSGKKMQKRRNHYNAFLKEYPDYVYRDLDIVEDFEIILSCLNRWENEKDDMSESMTSEVRGIMYLLSSKHMLDFEVGGIFIRGQMEAFIIASRLKHSTIQIHVEKANKEIRGLYPAVLKAMLEHHFPDEKYVNREEDMGLENLRKSKQSLHPFKMVHKYCIKEKNFEVVMAKSEEKDEVMRLWKTCFKDETEISTNFYFQYLYNCHTTYLLKNYHQVLSALQIVPMTICKNNHKEVCYLILGVSTDPHVQGQGCMKYLLTYVLNQFKDQKIYLQAYVPEIYHPFGFYASHYHQCIDVDKSQLLMNTMNPISDISLLKSYYEAYTASFDEYRLRDQQYWNLFIKRCQAFEEKILIFKDLGYFVYYQDEEAIHISEFIYLNETAILMMLSYWHDTDLKILLECDMRVKIAGDSQNIITMMSNQELSDHLDRNKFINEVY